MLCNQKIPPWRRTSGPGGAPSMQTIVSVPQGQPIYNPSMGLQQQQNRFMQPPMSFPQWQINSPTVQYPAADSMGTIRFPNQPPSQLALSPMSANATKFDPNNRVYSGVGTVTKTDNNWGFIDEEVFFHQGVCDKGITPKVGDRVMVDADYHSNLLFKWRASRVQILYPTNTNSTVNSAGRSHGGLTSNPMASVSPNVENRSRNRYSPTHKSPDRQAHRGRVVRDNSDQHRERSYERREKERSPPRKTPPKRKRVCFVPRYKVHVPKHLLTIKSADVLEVRRRYGNLYIPSDFFVSDIRWTESFPAGGSFSFRNPCPFYIMPKDVDSPGPQQLGQKPADLDPVDADYLYSAKVMLLSTPEAAEFYEKCSSKAEDHDGDLGPFGLSDYIHPSRLIRFLVGMRGNKKTMAIGGPWSPSLDGLDPHSDPSVLIRTAIRTCKAMTGIDLSMCTLWCRFVELYYRRSETLHKGHLIPSRVETVVIFLPDVRSCQPMLSDWELTRLCYKTDSGPAEANPGIVEHKTQQDATATQVRPSAASQATSYSPSSTTVAIILSAETDNTDLKTDRPNLSTDSVRAMPLSSLSTVAPTNTRITDQLEDEIISVFDEESLIKPEQPVEVTKELETAVAVTVNTKVKSKDKRTMGKAKLGEDALPLPDKGYVLPEKPHIIVHPSRVAKSGKFECSIMSLSMLLDYRPEDTKECSFEVSLFAELFNDMLARDFGFTIYKELCLLPAAAKKESDQKDGSADGTTSSKSNGNDSQTRSKVRQRSASRSDKDRSEWELATKACAKPDLMLSFLYFDVTRCGYIFEKDVEDIICALGLNLPRSQIHKIVAKATIGNTLQYRRLTEQTTGETESDRKKLPHDGTASDAAHTDLQYGAEKATSDTILTELACGNTNYRMQLKQSLDRIANELGWEKQRQSGKNSAEFDTANNEGASAIQKSGFVEYRGAFIDVEKLLQQLKRIDEALVTTEKRLQIARIENTELTSSNNRANGKVKELVAETKALSSKLVDAKRSVRELSSQNSKYYKTLYSVHGRIGSAVGQWNRKRFNSVVSLNHEGKKKKSAAVSSRCKEKVPLLKETKADTADPTTLHSAGVAE